MSLQPRTVSVPPLDIRAAVGPVNDENRTVELTFTTGADVVRYDWDSGRRYIERLSMDPKHIRLDRLNNGAPLLDTHSAYSLSSQIGVVEDGTAKITGKEGRSSVRFSKRADVEPFYQDVRDKIIRNVSVGYKTYRAEIIGTDPKSSLEIRLITDWEPYEISMCPMAADPGAQTRSSKDVKVFPCVVTTHISDDDRGRRVRLARARF